MAAHQAPLQYHLDNEEDLISRLASKGLKVLEVYSDWCGTCKSVLPVCKKIRVDKDDEAALAFLTIPAEKCQRLDAAKEHQGKSEPLFLLYRNGQLKTRVNGANVPSLSSSIYELTPANADFDDLEENPLYLSLRKGGGGKDAGQPDAKQKAAKKK
eukprot:GHRR01010463.1.p1 GENE.GHRR01010463.1~~GHRR01010463.1.p1  ORF type:complete len:156 (+),score=43.70 GHRR01010463.1:105-572(+)